METLKKETFVVVDDDSMMRDMLKLILRGEGYSVVGEAGNGADAITKCERFQPDVVLLDINMPLMDGIHAIDEIRRVSIKTMIVMVSADATMDKVSGAIKRGASGFIVKPLNAASVLDRITSLLRTRKV